MRPTRYMHRAPLPTGPRVFRLVATLIYLVLLTNASLHLAFRSQPLACSVIGFPLLLVLGIAVALSWCRLGMIPAGYCGRCGYPLPQPHSGTCPECGAQQ